jgi:hypothetical protein
MTPVAATDKAVARTAASAFGGKPRVDRFYDDAEEHSIDLLSCTQRPNAGFASYSTVGLYRTPNTLDDTDVRVELAGVCSIEATEFPNVLATAAFGIVKEHWLCAPGVVFPALLSDCGLSETLQHVVWVPPFPWEELAAVSIDDNLEVHWLLAVPISDSERQFLIDRGYDVFEALFSEHEVPYFDLDRAPIV